MTRNKPQLKPHTRSYMDRTVDTYEVHQRFLIVCEGKTEPLYFEKFRFPGFFLQVEGLGMNTGSLVEEALKLREKDEYDQVWCVFDKDDFPIDKFENAIHHAQSNGINVAYSNQAFELWYVLHFEYLHTAIDRNAYMKKLDGYLKFEYKKNDPRMHEILRCKTDTAIRNSKRLMREYQNSHPGRDDPSTTVQELVSALCKNSKPFPNR